MRIMSLSILLAIATLHATQCDIELLLAQVQNIGEARAQEDINKYTEEFSKSLRELNRTGVNSPLPGLYHLSIVSNEISFDTLHQHVKFFIKLQALDAIGDTVLARVSHNWIQSRDELVQSFLAHLKNTHVIEKLEKNNCTDIIEDINILKATLNQQR